jgi:4-hydroxy-3-polyprenylbenzoate decarboxylase
VRLSPHGSTPLAYDDLRDWIKTLEKHGELKRIREEVSPELEITEITDRISKIGSGPRASVQGSAESPQYAPGGPALLFENVKGHPGHKVFINQFGSERRMALALGVDNLEEIADRIKGLMNVKAPEGFLDKLKMLPQLGALTSAFPKTVSAKDAPCKEVILKSKDENGFANFDLNAFPILKCWPYDGGRFITLPCVHTRDPRSGKRNIGMYRMQVYNANRVPPSTIATRCAKLPPPPPMPIQALPASPPWPSRLVVRYPFPTAPSAACPRWLWAT